MEQNHNMLRGISENGGIVFYGVDSTEIVCEMERLHKTSAVTTAALGRLLTAASMMGIMLKSTQDSVTLQIKGGGPAGRLLAVSDGTGNVKADLDSHRRYDRQAHRNRRRQDPFHPQYAGPDGRGRSGIGP